MRFPGKATGTARPVSTPSRGTDCPRAWLGIGVGPGGPLAFPEFERFCTGGFPPGTPIVKVCCVYQFRHVRPARLARRTSSNRSRNDSAPPPRSATTTDSNERAARRDAPRSGVSPAPPAPGIRHRGRQNPRGMARGGVGVFPREAGPGPARRFDMPPATRRTTQGLMRPHSISPARPGCIRSGAARGKGPPGDACGIRSATGIVHSSPTAGTPALVPTLRSRASFWWCSSAVKRRGPNCLGSPLIFSGAATTATV